VKEGAWEIDAHNGHDKTHASSTSSGFRSLIRLRVTSRAAACDRNPTTPARGSNREVMAAVLSLSWQLTSWFVSIKRRSLSAAQEPRLAGPPLAARRAALSRSLTTLRGLFDAHVPIFSNRLPCPELVMINKRARKRFRFQKDGTKRWILFWRKFLRSLRQSPRRHSESHVAEHTNSE
jgi:hypothetical protein